MAASNIAVYSLSDLKNTTDDALPNYLTSLKFKQSHILTDVRLALSSTAVVIAAITFYADYKLGWDATKQGTFWAVLAYFILNGALTFWIWGVEKGKVFVGEGKDGALLSISSSTQKHSPVYHLKVRTSASRTAEPTTSEISCPFTKWFDSNGYFIAKPFQQWLSYGVSVIGDADPKTLETARKVRDDYGHIELTDGDAKIAENSDTKGIGSGKETSSKKIRERSRKNLKM